MNYYSYYKNQSRHFSRKSSTVVKALHTRNMQHLEFKINASSPLMSSVNKVP